MKGLHRTRAVDCCNATVTKVTQMMTVTRGTNRHDRRRITDRQIHHYRKPDRHFWHWEKTLSPPLVEVP